MLAQLVTLLISPLGTALALASLALALGLFIRRPFGRRLALAIALLAFTWLWLWSTPLASEALRAQIEDRAGPRSLDDIPGSEVMVVLGGGIKGPRPPRRPDPDLGSAADRMWHAARLFKAGKAQRILLSGGTTASGDGSEADAMQRFLIDLGVPASALHQEATSINTAANARLTARLLSREGIDEVILVTSALHMPRARRLFERAGLKVIPAPTDFEVIDMPFDAIRLLPDTMALHRSGSAIKEMAGWIAAR